MADGGKHILSGIKFGRLKHKIEYDIATLGVETFAWRKFRGKRNARNFVHFAWINFRGWTQ